MADNLFAVIYQGYVKAGRESEYQQAWNLVASHFIKHRGALGSALHKSEGGLWLAYSRWPDKKTRDASWPKEGQKPRDDLPHEIQKAILTLKDCVDSDRKIPEICLNVVNDLF